MLVKFDHIIGMLAIFFGMLVKFDHIFGMLANFWDACEILPYFWDACQEPWRRPIQIYTISSLWARLHNSRSTQAETKWEF